MNLEAQLITSSQAMCITDRNGFITHANVSHTRMMRAGKGRITGLNWREFTSEADWSRLGKLEASVFAGRPIGYKVNMLHPSGLIIPASVNAFRVESASGTFVINTVRPLPLPQRVRQFKNKEIAVYIADLSKELADMAEQHDLAVLSRHLREAVWMAGDALEHLADLEEIRH